MKELFEITKTLCNERSKSVNVVKDKLGNLLTEETVPEVPIADLECELVIAEISTSHITIRKMKNGKSGGKDNITVELLKVDRCI